MKFCIRLRLSVIMLLLLFTSGIRAQSSAVCDNEDFEAGPAGPVTSTNGIQGWTSYKISSPQFGPILNNCTLLSSTAAVRANPTAVKLFTANGLVDTILGANYPVYSVFGGTVSNGGESYNPELNFMAGNSFLRLGDAAGISYNNQAIEKTFSVTLSNCLFRLAILPVIHKGANCCDAPSVKLQFFNASSGNTVLPCPSYSINVNGSTCANPLSNDLVLSPNPYTFETYYRKWRVIAVDLTPYIGMTIGCRIGAFYCATGCAKYAYAYLDAQCGPMEIKVNGSVFPASTNSVTFKGCGITQATVTTPPHFSSYQWSGPSNFSSTLSTITTSASGVYTLNITPVGTCSTITKYINIGVYPAPSVSIATSKSVMCKGEQVKITASGLTTYSWNVPGSTATITVSPLNTATYNVSGVDANGCSGSASVTQSVTACTSLTERPKGDTTIKIYPNPNDGEFKVEMESTLQEASAEIRNSFGQLIRSFQLTDNLTRLNIRGVQPGLYFIAVKNGSRVVYNSRLAIQ